MSSIYTKNIDLSIDLDMKLQVLSNGDFGKNEEGQQLKHMGGQHLKDKKKNQEAKEAEGGGCGAHPCVGHMWSTSRYIINERG